MTITQKGTNNRAVTDFDGNYTIVTDDNDAVLQFSYLGYKTKELTAGTSHSVNTVMSVDAKAIDEVVVTALGIKLSLIHISEPTRLHKVSRMPSSA